MSQDPIERIHTYLHALRRRLDRVGAAEAGLAALACFGLALLAALLLGALLGPGPGRWGWLLIGAGLTGSGALAFTLWRRPRAGRASDEALARWVEARVSHLDSGLITTVQAREAMRTGDVHRWPGFSASLARATAGATATRLDGASPEALVDTTRRTRLARLAAVVVVGGLSAVALSPGFFADGARALVVPPPAAADPGVREVEVALSDLSLRLIYPAYMDLQPRDVPRSSGDLSAVAGTEVRFSGRTTLPATSAVMEFESDPDSRWPVELEEGGVARGLFRVGSSDRYRFLLTTSDGEVVRESRWRTIEARPDLAPDIRLLLPEADLEVHPDEEVSFLYEGVDDHGLDKVEMVISRDGAEPERRLLRQAAGERSARGNESLAVSPLGLEPGDGVEVWFEASDLNTVSGPGVGKSAVRRLTMHSPEAEHEERLADMERLLEQLVGALADRLESPIDEDDPLELPRYVAAQQAVSESVGRALETFRALVEALETDVLAADGLRDTLAQVLDGLQGHHDQEAAQLRQAAVGAGLTRRPVELLAVLTALNDEGVGDMEEAIWTLKKSLDQSRTDKLLEAGRELLDTQADLMKLLEQMKAGPDDALTRDAERKLDQLMKRLADMQKDLGKLGERSPYENQNMQTEPSDTQQEMSSIHDQAEEIRKLLREGKIDEAMKKLEELNRQTQEMMAQLQSEMGDGSQMAGPTRRKLQELGQRMGEVADGQRGVHDETDALRQKMAERQRQEMQARLDEVMKDAADKARELEKKLAETPEAELPASDKEALRQLRQKAHELRKSVESQELESARDQAKKVAGECNGLGTEVGETESRELDEARAVALKDAIAKLGQGEKLAQDIADALDALQQQMQGPPSAGERGQMGQLGQRQGDLERAVGELREKLQSMEGEVPGIGDELDPALEGAGEAMQRASEQLEGEAPDEAARHQREAMDRLQQAQKALQKKMQSDPRGQQEGVGTDESRKKVAIPEAEDYRAPEAFRQELMKAMKERAPERFKRAIDRYYEELVK
ncbi:MAG: DUF4175 family protein [Deltaproteobacteria bacterium]|nr:DUF4175 family protein [Deltaproteobacteria bacterium]MCB9787166.1 DUF4175 family protein [Deltaproteobacteria bacterium]